MSNKILLLTCYINIIVYIINQENEIKITSLILALDLSQQIPKNNQNF